MYANTEIPNSIVQCVEVTRAVRQGTSCFVLSLLSQKQNWLFFYALDRLIFQTTIFLNYFIFPYVCAVYVCLVHMHTLMRVHSACVCRCREQRRCWVSPSLILCIITLRQGFSLDRFYWAGGQQAARIHLSSPLSAGAIGALSHTLLFDMGPGDPNSARVLAQWAISPAQVTFFVNAAFDDSGICENLRARRTKVDRGAFQWDILEKLCHCHTRERNVLWALWKHVVW